MKHFSSLASKLREEFEVTDGRTEDEPIPYMCRRDNLPQLKILTLVALRA